jgi:DeoR/GlpR family transcriptional regulator of sugar metabolism
LLQHDRLIKIQAYLKENQAASTKSLAEYLGVSIVTIRKDLDMMEDAGIVTRTHGGAILVDASANSKPSQPPLLIPDRIDIVTDLAKDYVCPGDFIYLGSGRTCISLAEKIKEVKGISVITNNVSALSILKPHVENIVLLGGEIVMTPDGLFSAYDANFSKLVSGLFVNKAFSGGVGIDSEIGLTVNNMLSAHVTRTIPQLSEEWYVMMDSSKFGIRAFYQAAELDKISHLVTDVTNETELQKFRDKGLHIISP